MPSDDRQTLGLRERKKAKTMAAIQTHAIRLVREQGYNATTVEQIAEAAEISPSTFFRYFPTKEDVILTDGYDPLMIELFQEQPADLSPMAAVRQTMLSILRELPADEMAIMLERNQLIMAIPELRAAMLNNLTQTMQMIAEMVAHRVSKPVDDWAVRVFAGSIIGVSISVLVHHAEHPELNFVELLDQAFAQLESGLTL